MGLAAFVLGTLLAWSAAAPAGRPRQEDPQVAAGRQVYEREKCATCHQIANRGNSRFPLDGVASRLTAAEIRRWITDTAAMEMALPRLPPIRMSSRKYNLKPADLDALVAFLRTLK